jgi:hypothetical protein
MRERRRHPSGGGRSLWNNASVKVLEPSRFFLLLKRAELLDIHVRRYTTKG